MRKSTIKKLRPCFGKRSKFYRDEIKECVHCQFKRRCLLEANGKINE